MDREVVCSDLSLSTSLPLHISADAWSIVQTKGKKSSINVDMHRLLKRQMKINERRPDAAYDVVVVMLMCAW